MTWILATAGVLSLAYGAWKHIAPLLPDMKDETSVNPLADALTRLLTIMRAAGHTEQANQVATVVGPLCFCE
jgi:hypothetical protein